MQNPQPININNDNYEETIFIEEALHRLVEIYYNLGLIEEAEKTAKILGYNYISSIWYENSYSLLYKDYKKERAKLDEKSKKGERGLVRKTIALITVAAQKKTPTTAS